VPKRYFISTRKDRAAQATELENALKDHGWHRTYEWSEQDGEGHDAHAKLAAAELEGVGAADVLIVLLPGGLGTHVEIGAALALGKPVILCSPDEKTLATPYLCIFHYHPLVRRLISDPVDIQAVLNVLP
jgi:nucleoside 2-deoxyribosyltransferase